MLADVPTTAPLASVLNGIVMLYSIVTRKRMHAIGAHITVTYSLCRSNERYIAANPIPIPKRAMIVSDSISILSPP